MPDNTKAAELAEKLTPFDYLLNAYTRAAQDPHPAKRGYAGKRKALLQHVRELEAKAAQVDALLRASEGRVPEGWKLVPVEPTTEMINACHLVPDVMDVGDEYRAMLTASPTPPAAQQGVPVGAVVAGSRFDAAITPVPRIEWTDCMPPVGTKLYTTPQPAHQADNAIVTSPSGSRWEVDPKWAPALQAALDGQQVGKKGGEQ